MIKIRLQRHGARHSPFYRMVVTPSTTRRDGKFIEVLGTYSPKAHARTEELKLKMDRIDHWLGVGAQPTDTAKSLIRQGRLTPEEWLKKSEREAAKRLARAQKSDVTPQMEEKKEDAPAAEPEPEEAKPESKVVAEVKEETKEEAPAAKPEAKAEESKPEKKAAVEAKEEKKEEASAAKPEAKAEESKPEKKAAADVKEEKKEDAKAVKAKPVKKAPASKKKEDESK